MGLEIRKVKCMDDIYYLRNEIYVNEKGRIDSNESMVETFDRYDACSEYFVAYYSDVPVGCSKVIFPSDIGLPCEEFVDIKLFTNGAPTVEVGHLLTLKKYRSQKVATWLLREAFHYAIRKFRPSYFVGDFFEESHKADGLHSYYKFLGFEVIHGPYQDPRFLNSPSSVIAMMNVEHGFQLWKNSTGKQHRLLDIFYANYKEVSNAV